MKKIYNWLVPPELVQQISSGRTGEQVLTVYIKLARRINLPLIALSFVLIVLTTIRVFETPPWLSGYFSVDLKLDGQTIANYVAMIFGTVVAFAGSLVAITLAMEAQKTSEETKKLEEAGQRRETEKYAREIKKELNTFFRLHEKAFRTIETLPDYDSWSSIFLQGIWSESTNTQMVLLNRPCRLKMKEQIQEQTRKN